MWAELALNESKQGIIRNWFTFFLVSSPLEGQQGVHSRCASGRNRQAQQWGTAGGVRREQQELPAQLAWELGTHWGPSSGFKAFGGAGKPPSQLPAPPVAMALWVPVPTARHPCCGNLPLPSSRRRAALQRQLHV